MFVTWRWSVYLVDAVRLVHSSGDRPRAVSQRARQGKARGDRITKGVMDLGRRPDSILLTQSFDDDDVSTHEFLLFEDHPAGRIVTIFDTKPFLQRPDYSDPLLAHLRRYPVKDTNLTAVFLIPPLSLSASEGVHRSNAPISKKQLHAIRNNFRGSLI